MNKNPAITVLLFERQKLSEKLEALLAETKELKVGIRAFDDAIATLEGLSGVNAVASAVERSSSGRVALKHIILEILEAKPGQGTQQIKSELAARGRDTDLNTILGTLSRMRRDDSSIHKHDGVWYAISGDKKHIDVNIDASESEKASNEFEAFQEFGADDGSQGAATHPSPAGSTPVSSTVAQNDPLAKSSSRLSDHQTPHFKR